MRYHHTKNKGDLGVLHAQLDLARRGYGVLLPLTEHETFDLVAYKDHRFLRVQVKYRAAVNGVIQIPLSSVWRTARGTIWSRSIGPQSSYCASTARTPIAATTSTLRIVVAA